jgi:uncharacterized membrane-anchored protein
MHGLLIITLSLLISGVNFSLAKDEPKTEKDSTKMVLQAIEKNLKYETGEVKIGTNLANIKIPAGFRFLDAKQAQYIVYDVWGNPKGDENKVFGLIIPEKLGVTENGSWAFIVEYDEMGFVKDDDADKINYDDMLKEMKTDENEANEQRKKMGFDAVHIVGWAQKPYYDKEKKVLHWAKELSFEGSEENTLNYNIRVLGRKGVLVLNAVGDMNRLPEINQNIASVLGSVQFLEGSRYADFNPSVDKVAAWTVGGLVAGKVLAKVGLFAILAKFGKIIFLAIAGAGGAIWRMITGKRKEEEEVAVETEPEKQETV